MMFLARSLQPILLSAVMDRQIDQINTKATVCHWPIMMHTMPSLHKRNRYSDFGMSVFGYPTNMEYIFSADFGQSEVRMYFQARHVVPVNACSVSDDSGP